MDVLTGFISEPEYARARRVTVRTCQRDRRLRQAPPYIIIGRQVFYRIEAVREWLVKNERTVDLAVDAPRSRTRRSSGGSPRACARTSRSSPHDR